MSVTVSLMVALLLQASPDPDGFRLQNVTVTDIARVAEINDLRIASYLRLVVRSGDGDSSVVYVAAQASDPHEMGIQKTGVCSFEGRRRPWMGDRALAAPAPAVGELTPVADSFQCRPTSDQRPAAPLDSLLPPMPPLPPAQSTTVVIIGVGESPQIPSGVLHTATLILGQSEDGRIAPYYMTFHGDQAPVPPLGSRCVLHHRASTGSIMVGGLSLHPGAPGQVFWEFDCAPPPSWEDMLRMNPGG